MRKYLIVFMLIILIFAGIFSAGAANQIRTQRGNLPWKVDTVGTLTNKEIIIHWIIWYGCTTDGHDFVLKDTAGNLVHEDTDGEEGKPHVFYPGTNCTGLELEKLDSGYLLMGISYR